MKFPNKAIKNIRLSLRLRTVPNFLVNYSWNQQGITFLGKNKTKGRNSHGTERTYTSVARAKVDSYGQIHTEESYEQIALQKLAREKVVDEHGFLNEKSLEMQAELLHRRPTHLQYSSPYNPTKFASVLMPLINSEHRGCLLLTQRSTYLRSHAGQMCFPGGRVEPSDGSHYYTALRETYEEIDLLPNFFTYINRIPPLLTKDLHTKIHTYVAFTLQNNLPSLGFGEVEKLYCIPLTSFLNPNYQKIAKFRNTNLEYVEFNIKDVPRIWGITAVILNMYFRSLCPDSLIPTSNTLFAIC
ncbi:coenzyme A diphosphatase [Schizosaccharomyces cryophilus OY26]|uniref:Coenzyme A diphosphatase n=1 Tax=Schizosaccharomyces cryophilus (strain OY26 / ATCC MYA-4695 / CBS 11777 / NBRC 106824 / NRRL Y48691) TaxID=653667 RepID=S9X503_SCHCR|nr:coenzyme A diphosphatase [Schizosaccharomyces cryophilus OY26]EPY52162.1 coenzyme A diphosphatase [Schizosaccharomyces cryophilus OY26]